MTPAIYQKGNTVYEVGFIPVREGQSMTQTSQLIQKFIQNEHRPKC